MQQRQPFTSPLFFGTLFDLVPRDLSQSPLLDQIDLHRRLSYQSPLPRDNKGSIIGFCQGLSVFWLKKMASGEEETFYKTVERIIASPSNMLGQRGNFIDDFFNEVHKCQFPEQYFPECEAENPQDCLQFILNAEKQQYQAGKYQPRDIIDILYEKENSDMFCIGTDSEEYEKHGISIFIKNNFYYLFDANFKSGRPKIISEAWRVVEELEKSFYAEMAIPDEWPLTFMKVEAKWLKPAIEEEAKPSPGLK